MFFNWFAPGASALSRFASSQLASVTWCQFAIRIASIRCCKTWLAQADSRAIWIVSMAEEFIRKDRKSTRLNLQSRFDLVCRLLLEKKKKKNKKKKNE